MLKALARTFTNYCTTIRRIRKFEKQGLTEDQIVYKFTIDLIREQFEFFGIDTTKMRDIEITEGFKTVAKIVASGVSMAKLEELTKHLGATTKFSAAQFGEAMTSLVRAMKLETTDFKKPVKKLKHT